MTIGDAFMAEGEGFGGTDGGKEGLVEKRRNAWGGREGDDGEIRRGGMDGEGKEGG